MARNIEFIPEEKIEQALNVFCEKGYSATTLNDLVNAMQINKSSLYNSFKDKHTLYKECLRTYGRINEEDYRSAINKQGLSPLQLIERIIDKITDKIIENNTSCLCISASFELASHHRDVHAIIKKTNENTIGLIQMLLKEAQDNNQLAKEKDCKTMGHLIFSTLGGLWYNYKVYEDGKLVREVAQELKDLLKH